jgi:thiol peroxidase
MTRLAAKALLVPVLVAACWTCGCRRDKSAATADRSSTSPPRATPDSGTARREAGSEAGSEADAVARTDLVMRQGKPLTVLGEQPEVGDAAPAFTAVANDMSTYSFEPGAGGRVYVLSAVPSLDTPTCSAETKRFNEEAATLGDRVSVLTVSMDLPFAQKRWCGAEGVTAVQTLSDSRDRAFGRAYGLRIRENGLLARAVFVVGKDGKIVYRQIVPEISKEPDYEPILAATRAAAAK